MGSKRKIPGKMSKQTISIGNKKPKRIRQKKLPIIVALTQNIININNTNSGNGSTSSVSIGGYATRSKTNAVNESGKEQTSANESQKEQQEKTEDFEYENVYVSRISISNSLVSEFSDLIKYTSLLPVQKMDNLPKSKNITFTNVSIY